MIDRRPHNDARTGRPAGYYPGAFHQLGLSGIRPGPPYPERWADQLSDDDSYDRLSSLLRSKLPPFEITDVRIKDNADPRLLSLTIAGDELVVDRGLGLRWTSEMRKYLMNRHRTKDGFYLVIEAEGSHINQSMRIIFEPDFGQNDDLA